MDFFDAVTKHIQTKKFEKTEVDDKLIGVMLYMANHAESAGDQQAWEFVVVRDEKVKKHLDDAALKIGVIKSAPISIVVCADLTKQTLKYHERGEYLYSLQDTASAITIMQLTAEILGLGTNWIRAFDEGKIKMILELPDDMRPVGIVSVGYPIEKVKERNLKPFENLTWLNRYRGKSNQSYMFQVGPKEEAFKPIVNQILDKLKKK